MEQPWGNLAHSHSSPSVPPARLSNTSRLDSLIRDGQLYVSLQDAIALALENNLDIELQRYDLQLADTEIVRVKSGAFPRGVPLYSAAANTPALNGVVGNSTETDLSILGSIRS